jgi:oxygen-dependent protoporphyrinogen oxidase
LLGPRTRARLGLVTFAGGMQALVDRLEERVRPSLRLGVEVDGLRFAREGTQLLTSGGTFDARAVVLACPASRARALLEPHDEALSAELAGIRSTDVAVVSLGFARDDVLHALDGTGFVVDPALERALVACTWSSRKWHGRAPDDRVLLRCVVDAPRANHAELVAIARDEVRFFLGIHAVPKLVRVRRRLGALPVYAPGHRERVNEARGRARRLGVELAGNAYDGVGVPDCLASGIAAADAILARA